MKAIRVQSGLITVFFVYILLACFTVPHAHAAAMKDYCVAPPFIASTVPPLVMFDVGREHKLYYEAYNDSVDLNEDGRLDTEYNHSIEYYGYFDPYKCYVHSGGSGSNDKFTPVSVSSTKFCNSSGGQLSGNFLNWLTMSRMDVLKKVLYGGQRSADSVTSTVLKRVYIPMDAHSWGKEATGRLCYNTGTVTESRPEYTNMCLTSDDCDSGYSCVNKSKELIGISASTAPSACPSSVYVGNTNNKILVVRYTHSSSLTSDLLTGTSHTNLLASYEPSSLKDYALVSDFDDSILDSGSDHFDYYNILATAEFNVVTTNKAPNEKGQWQFIVDGDDGVDLEIFPAGATYGTVVASYYGAHSDCFSSTEDPNTVNYKTSCPNLVPGSIDLPSGWTRMVVRHTDRTGQDGVRVWVKRTNDATWQLFGSTTFGNNNLRTPEIKSSNDCSVKVAQFIETGVPAKGAVTGKHHLYCNTTLKDGDPPIVRVLTDRSERIWQWASKEAPVCDNSLGTPKDYTVQVEVCNNSVGLETNCKEYPSANKPVGLLQKYGETLEGGKLCSKTMARACNSDSDCDFATEGQCVDRSAMYFGLMTDSYTKNLSGGVLRKNIGSILDETNANNGIFQTSENEQGNIIITLDRLKTINYSSNQYKCGWITTRPLNEGECLMWGNPIAEMMYESLRYFAGKGSPTPEFTYSDSKDSGLSLSKPDWGYRNGSEYEQLFAVYPRCARPFIILLSDINTSYDSDQLPGSSFAKAGFKEDSNPPMLNLAKDVDGESLLNHLTNVIGTEEKVNSNNWFIGENGSVTDFICSSKKASELSLLRGMCPEEPTKLGSFYSAGIAYYGNIFMNDETNTPNVTTFAVALSSPVADMKVKVGGTTVTFVPAGKSVSGSYSLNDYCAKRCTLKRDSDGLHISNCSSNSFCPSNQIVDFYIDDIRYDSSKSVTYAKFRINYEDVEQGADHDMDAIVTYEICTQVAIDNGYGSCSGTLGSNNLQVKLSSEYAAGSIDQVLGFVISGTTEDGIYLPVKDKDVGGQDSNTPDVVALLPLNWEKTFTVSSASAASGFLKSPLWYAAKWGGFVDKNSNNLPDLDSEWDKDGDGDPDNYFLVVNPLKLEEQLDKALSEILARVSSGTAASILNNSEGSGANLLQAIFYPQKDFDDNTEVSWIGELHNLWYYLDPFYKTTIREDTANNDTATELNLDLDRIADFVFDDAQNATVVEIFSDSNGDNIKDSISPKTTLSPDNVNSLWRAGELLHRRNLRASPRRIYTYTSGVGLTPFDTSATNLAKIKPYLDVSDDDTKATSVIKYITGYDDLDDTSLRSRTVSFKGVGGALTDVVVKSNAKDKGIGVWKLGDIVSSTPQNLSDQAVNSYQKEFPNGYKDATYTLFLNSSTYESRGMTFVGANDGMLHAFRLGTLEDVSNYKTHVMARISGDDLGMEEWAFIPKNALPYLKYLSSTDPEYCHIYYVDKSVKFVDASIARLTSCGSSTDYWDCERTHTNKDGSVDLSWRTLLVGGMGLGGASVDPASPYSSGCVTTPLQVSESGVTKDIGYSSYFALDVTEPTVGSDPTSPNFSFKWEFAGDPANGDYLGYSTTGPAFVRVGPKGKNGRWLAVFGSGPTGPIDTALRQFRGESSQKLKLFVVDIATGELLRVFKPDIENAFVGSLSTSVIDTERYTDYDGDGVYQDDAIYIGYTRRDDTVSPAVWRGGVLRLLTKESVNVDDWELSELIRDIGPVTTSVTKLQSNSTLWLYFGTGRYFFKDDDSVAQQTLYGIQEPCYSMIDGVGDIDNACTKTLTDDEYIVSVADLTDKTVDESRSLPTDSKGWFVNLHTVEEGFLAERVITDPLALGSGVLYFTTFMPTADICGFGGNTYVWALDYATGGKPNPRALKGVGLLQVSTGSFEQIDFSSAFENSRRTEIPIKGAPPKDQGLAAVVPPSPLRKILQYQEH